MYYASLLGYAVLIGALLAIIGEIFKAIFYKVKKPDIYPPTNTNTVQDFKEKKREYSTLTLNAEDEFGKMEFDVSDFSTNLVRRLEKIINECVELWCEYGLKLRPNLNQSVMFLVHDVEFVNKFGDEDGGEFSCWIERIDNAFSFNLSWSVSDDVEYDGRDIKSIAQIKSEYRKFLNQLKAFDGVKHVGPPMKVGELPPVFPGFDLNEIYDLEYVDRDGVITERKIKDIRIGRRYLNSRCQFGEFEAYCLLREDRRTFKSRNVRKLCCGGQNYLGKLGSAFCAYH